MLYKIANAPILAADVSPADVIASWKDSNVAPSYVNAEQGEWNFEKREGMLYVAVRAVSVGTNGNGDHFTEDELHKAYKTFIGKGVFVNHASNDIEKKRGMIVDARWVDAGPADKYVVTLLEMNATAYPEFCNMIKAKQIDSVSMGCQVAFSQCSVCSHVAKTTKDYCMHVRGHKGGAYNGKPVYEINRGVEFIEVSWVTVGADPQAKLLSVIARQRGLDFQQLLHQAAKGQPVAETLETQGMEYTIMQGIRRVAQAKEQN